MRAIREYLKIAVPLLSAMILYRLLLVPWIEPVAPPPMTAALANAPRPEEDFWWNHYFLPGAWQSKNPAILKTKNGVLLFEKWEQLSATSLKLSPLTIILPRGKGDILGSQRPDCDVLFIENPEGAEIQFQDSVEGLTSGQPPPPVIGGLLKGEIQIVGPSTRPGKPDLWMSTRDIHIDKKHLWTQRKVQMKLGASTIEGSDLSIYLDKNLLSASTSNNDEDLPFQGLDRLELIYVDRVEFELPKGGLWTPKDSTRSPPASVSLACKGSFQFDFHTMAAHLSNDVQIVHRVEGEMEDRFWCDDLRLWLAITQSPVTPLSKDHPTNWTIDHLEAIGKPQGNDSVPGWWVRMEAPGMKTRAQGRRLELDFVRGRIELSNHFEPTSRPDATRVFFERDGLRVWSPSVEIENDELAVLGKKAPNLHLGTLYAEGPGTAQLLTQDKDEWKLSWANTLRLQPDGDQDLLTVDGSANTSSLRHGRFSAEVLNIWLFRISPEIQAALAKRHPTRKVDPVFVDRFHAKGQVIIDSPQLRAQVEDMQVWLIHPDIAQLGSNSSVGGEVGIELNAADGKEKPSALVQPPNLGNTPSGPGQLSRFSAVPDLGPSTPKPALSAHSLPLNITGPILRSRVIVEPHRTVIDDLEIEGGVTLIRDRVSDESDLPLTVTGERLKLNTVEGGLMDVQIIGVPAAIKVGSGTLVGPEVRFNQRSQLVWMDHPGSLVLPPEVLAMQTTNRLSPTSIQWIAPPRIEWAGNMTFDGKVARVGGGVQLSGDARTDPMTRWVVRGNSDSLEVHLAQPVAIGQPSNNLSTIPTTSHRSQEIDRLILRDRVDIRATQTDPSGLQEKSRERISVPELSFDLKKQTMEAPGPGWIRSRRMGMPRVDPSFGMKPEANRQGLDQPTLQCLHLVFSGAMKGFMQSNEITFENRVEALLGPIRSWDDTLDVHQIQQLAIDQSLMRCDRLRIYSTSNLSWNQSPNPSNHFSAWEMSAEGNVDVESVANSGNLSVQAPLVQFSGVQEVLKIYGNPRKHGIITLRPHAGSGSQPYHSEVSYIEVNTRTQTLANMKLYSASGGLPNQPGMNEPPNGAPVSTSTGSNLQNPRELLNRRNR